MSIRNWLEDIDPRIIFWLLVILIALPMITPLGLPVFISDNTERFAEEMREVPSGGAIVMSLDHSVGAATNVRGQERVIARFFGQRGDVRILIWGIHQDTFVNFQTNIEPILQEYDMEYGKDYVLLGYLPGQETAVAKLADNVRAFSVDHFNNPVNDLEALEGLQDASDIDKVFTFDTSQATDYYIGHWYQRYDTQICGSYLGQYISTAEAQLSAGQLQAISGDIRGAAELEAEFDFPPESARITDTMSLTHSLILLLLLIGNVQYYLSRREK
jgi:hypothetical protein